ncbi:hypothetical protein [Streptomyces sp. NPDC093223]|uniref:hypothetical protein n=1 Tax=Streptomyces sp. NPDC093223 TaxID=3366033 RepID=UPI003825E83C
MTWTNIFGDPDERDATEWRAKVTETIVIPSRPDPSWHGVAHATYGRLISAMGLPSVRSAGSLSEFTDALVEAVPELHRAFGARPHVFIYMFRALGRHDTGRIEEAVHIFIDLYVSEFPEGLLRPTERAEGPQ